MNKTNNSIFMNFALKIVGRIQYNKVLKISKNCKKITAKTLRNILAYAKNSEYGKLHKFSELLRIKNDEDFFEAYRNSVSVSDYEEIRPFVERCKNGEQNILFPGKPLMYATTSGTTGKPKWIPITKEYYKNVYKKMSNIWLYCFIKNRPRCFEGKTVSIVGKAIEGEAPDGTVYGSVSGVTRRDIPKFISQIHSAPDAVFEISDYTSRYYTIMRIGIEQNVTIIVTANPSTIIEMQNNVNQFFDDYVDDIEKGTLNPKLLIPGEIREKICEKLSPNPKRAEELRQLKAKYGEVLPKHYWPNIQILATWKYGNTKIYVDKFNDSFPKNMLYQEFSYFATECRAGLVLDNDDATVLFPHYHYFEFVSIDDLDNPNPKYLQIYELEDKKQYSVFVTTFSGLYRYPMNDLIVVNGFFGTIPKVQLIQKINGIISMTGEKVHENQFIEAVHLAEEETGYETRFFIGFADVKNSVYHFYYEFDFVTLPQPQIELFNRIVDRNLKNLNIEYASKRESFRIKEPIPYALTKNSFETFKERCILAGARDGQFKLNLLMQNEEKHKMFKTLIRTN